MTLFFLFFFFFTFPFFFIIWFLILDYNSGFKSFSIGFIAHATLLFYFTIHTNDARNCLNPRNNYWLKQIYGKF